ncbi:hypothetical protein LRS71_23615 [Rhodococcus pyridinivorans]|uniref:hypothetical protein n=1 Tax=Rhodococcus pyridinivorans TaxID=103816 RepID=UPI001E3C0F56|nr:hypothetical protein [Rhodococcus pyridinivorans]MCD5422504.1 hypothetical protein [Rhodococcus pyridinivorans]
MRTRRTSTPPTWSTCSGAAAATPPTPRPLAWTRTATEPAPKIAALAVQACGALMLGAAALASASSWTAKLPILLSSMILTAACTYAYRRARQHSQSTD